MKKEQLFNEVTDTVAQIIKFHPKEIHKPKTELEVLSLIKLAEETSLKISVCGQKFSQGGQWVEDNAILIDFSNFNQVVSVGKDQITVQAGITWKEVQERINPVGMSVKVMQSSNVFSVGGAVSINCHGRDVRYGPIVNTIISLKVMTVRGETLICSRDENSELFFGVIGGMGLIAVILEVTLSLRKNYVCNVTHTELLPIEKFIDTYKAIIHKDPELAFGRVTISKDKFLTDFYITSYVATGKVSKDPIKNNKTPLAFNYLMALQRDGDTGKRLRESLEALYNKEEMISLNKAMNPPIDFLMYKKREQDLYFKRLIFSFKNSYRKMRNRPTRQTDVLREYFIPLRNFNSFINEMRALFVKDDVNLINITLRYVPKKESNLLQYVKEDCVALVLNVNIGLSETEIIKAKKWTQESADIALKNKGSFYLAYQPWETREQVANFYNVEGLLLLKGKHDPNGTLSSHFFNNILS